jgi:hypothetical protein
LPRVDEAEELNNMEKTCDGDRERETGRWVTGGEESKRMEDGAGGTTKKKKRERREGGAGLGGRCLCCLFAVVLFLKPAP